MYTSAKRNRNNISRKLQLSSVITGFYQSWKCFYFMKKDVIFVLLRCIIGFKMTQFVNIIQCVS